MVCKLTALAVVGAGMWFASAAPAAAQQEDFNAPDLVLINGKVLTLDERSTVTEAVAVREGRISRLEAAHRSSRLPALGRACSMCPARPSFPD